MIVTHYIAPIGKVINVKARRAWDFTALNQRQHRILGGK